MARDRSDLPPPPPPAGDGPRNDLDVAYGADDQSVEAQHVVYSFSDDGKNGGSNKSGGSRKKRWIILLCTVFTLLAIIVALGVIYGQQMQERKRLDQGNSLSAAQDSDLVAVTDSTDTTDLTSAVDDPVDLVVVTVGDEPPITTIDGAIDGAIGGEDVYYTPEEDGVVGQDIILDNEIIDRETPTIEAGGSDGETPTIEAGISDGEAPTIEAGVSDGETPTTEDGISDGGTATPTTDPDTTDNGLNGQDQGIDGQETAIPSATGSVLWDSSMTTRPRPWNNPETGAETGVPTSLTFEEPAGAETINETLDDVVVEETSAPQDQDIDGQETANPSATESVLWEPSMTTRPRPWNNPETGAETGVPTALTFEEPAGAETINETLDDVVVEETSAPQVVATTSDPVVVEETSDPLAVDSTSGAQVADSTLGAQAADSTLGAQVADSTLGAQAADLTLGAQVVDPTPGAQVYSGDGELPLANDGVDAADAAAGNDKEDKD